MTILLGSSWGSTGPMNQRPDVVSWLHELAILLARDANRSGVPNDLKTRVMQIAETIHRITADTPESDVEAAANSYAQARTSLGTYAYVSPPIDVAIPSMDDTTRAGPPREIDKRAFTEIERAAIRRLPAGDDLRGAINRWAAWAPSAHESTDVTDLASEYAPLTRRTSEWNDRHRARRLAAWATDRLVSLGAMPTTLPPLPGQPPDAPVFAPPPFRSVPRSTQSSSSGIGVAIVVLGGFYILTKILSRR